MTKLQLNSQQTVKPQQQIQPVPAIMFGLAVSTQGGPVKTIGEQKNVR